MQVLECSFNDLEIKLLDIKFLSEINKYTVFLGENGTGKSETLRQIINNILRLKIKDIDFYKSTIEGKFSYRDPLDSFLSNSYKNNSVEKNIKSSVKIFINKSIYIDVFYEKTNGSRFIKGFDGKYITISSGEFRHKFSIKANGENDRSKIYNLIKDINVIAISESCHIKFPIIQDDELLNYYYPGHLKESDKNYFNNYGVDKTIILKDRTIILSILKSGLRKNKNKLKDIFDIIKIQFRLKIETTSSGNIRSNLSNLSRIHFDSIAIDKKDNFSYLEECVTWYENQDLLKNKDIFNNNIGLSQSFDMDLYEDNKDIHFLYSLINYNLINISNIFFYKNDKEVTLQDMSSGQLCLINSFCAIAADIKDGSLIFIDEPEISLHPSWASKYIELLQSLFSDFYNCHFIIATHSPHIVSNLPDNDAFVVTIKDDRTSKCIPSNSFNFRSIDFQLAEVFDFPGNKNEYLVRIIMLILTKISEKKGLNQDDFDTVNHLKNFLHKLEDKDPVKHLINQISALVDNE
ncbi:AAA family ATPase [Acinetobacter pittii]|uniref:AAA family ATPase n=1 Tax=Acinetobacter pittii TaxID=48296 RepID=UPI000D34F7BB|nr:AAA family ATPase [Acinetobacter pittii]PTV48798.1 ATP-binding protein [Acinetobacter pittii]